jgi:transcriptional regulator with XRE-family HTH domain
MKSFGDRVKYLIDKSGVSETKIANAAGVSQTTLNSLTRGNTKSFSIDRIPALARALKTNISWLVAGEGSPTRTADQETSLNDDFLKRAILLVLLAARKVENVREDVIADIILQSYKKFSAMPELASDKVIEQYIGEIVDYEKSRTKGRT